MQSATEMFGPAVSEVQQAVLYSSVIGRHAAGMVQTGVPACMLMTKQHEVSLSCTFHSALKSLHQLSLLGLLVK